MRLRSILAALALGLIAPASVAETRPGAPFEVAVDQTFILKLKAPAESVVIGNGSVIGVAVHDATTLLVTGRAWGATNLLVLDAAGRTVYSNMIAVVDETPGRLTIVRGDGTYSYSCFDKCRSIVQAGDAPSHVSEVSDTNNAKKASAEGK
ncbi:hypothetical protein GC169_01340 [bacterium]|nr:hypothetical protein [bacterium]